MGVGTATEQTKIHTWNAFDAAPTFISVDENVNRKSII